MLTINSKRVSELARRLVEELHEPFTNEERWAIAEAYLTMAAIEGRNEGAKVGLMEQEETRKHEEELKSYPCGGNP